jgi:branched-chain amino acid:cation transporter, LIVCS family
MKKEGLKVVSTGFALFAMFFGSGNLVFPVTVGLESEGHYVLASLGILCTGVIFPFLGMLGIMLYRGSIEEFFGCFGKIGVFLFSFLALSLMGPFGVLARCLTVIHGALLLLNPSASLGWTNFLVCLVLFVLTLNKNRIVTILGSILTPFLLLAIAVIAFFGLYYGVMQEKGDTSGFDAFKNGFLTGYQTMDLVAAFFFSGFVIKQLGSESNHSVNFFLKASLIGAGLLFSVYFVLSLLGWLYQPTLIGVASQELFGQIAIEALGAMAAPFISLAVIVACMTTAIALTSLFADFLQKEVLREKIGTSFSLLITLTIAFLVSNLDFAGIANFLGPILETIYPALITLTVMNIVCKLWELKATHWPFTLTLLTKFYFV